MFMRKKRLSNFIKNGNKKKGIRAIVRPFRAFSPFLLFIFTAVIEQTFSLKEITIS